MSLAGASALVSGLMRLLMSSATLAAPCLIDAQLCVYRYAEYDIYGLAASLATSWAVLARSSPDETQGSFVCDVLHICAGALQKVRPHAHALRQAILRRPHHNRLRSAQMVALWCQADESEAWGEAATPRSAVLSQYYTGLSTVLVRLCNTPKLFGVPTDPAVAVRCAIDHDISNCTRCKWVRVVERPCCSRPCIKRLTDLSCLPQHLHAAGVLCDKLRLAGAAPDAAYLAAFCSAPGTSLLLHVLEQALAVSCAAEAQPPASETGSASAGQETHPDARGRWELVHRNACDAWCTALDSIDHAMLAYSALLDSDAEPPVPAVEQRWLAMLVDRITPLLLRCLQMWKGGAPRQPLTRVLRTWLL